MSPVLNQPSSVQRSACLGRVVVRRTRSTGRAPRARPSSRRPRGRAPSPPRARISTNGSGRPCLAPIGELLVFASVRARRSRVDEIVPIGAHLGHAPGVDDVQAVASLEAPRSWPAARPSRRRSSSRSRERSQPPGWASSVCSMPIQIVGTPAVERDLLARRRPRAGTRGRGAGPGRPASRRPASHVNGKPHAFAWNIGTTGSTTSGSRDRRASSTASHASECSTIARCE